MQKLFNNSRAVLNKQLGFFLFAALLLWIKTYAVYNVEFNLGIENTMQKFLLFMNPISSALLFLGFGLFAKGKKSYIWIIIIDFLLSFLLYANIVYYRFFNDFITVPTLTQTKNAGDLGQSIGALVHPYDFLYFIDTLLLIILVSFKFVKPQQVKMKRKTIVAVFTAAVVMFIVNLGLAETDRPQLLTRTFDRNYIVKYLGMYNYTIYDAIQSSKSSAQRALADTNDITEVENYVKANFASPNPEYFGKAKGMNVIYVSLESLQNFVIDYKLNGEEVTPFLNSLAHDGNTFYFNNFYHQTGQGKTSDAEFMMENSIFPLPQGAVFTTKGQNTFQAAPAIYDQLGYTTAVFHGNYKSFWNRDVMYKALGYEKFFDAEYYDMNEQDVVNYGLKDKPFFKESMPLLTSLKQPFYSKFITLTNHFPYPISEEEATIEPHTTGDGSVDRYFQTARYMDEAIEEFFNDLKEAGLYDNTVVVMYGDHYGISENHNAAMEKVMGKEITPFESAQLQETPLFIHVPGVKGGIQSQYGGQVDVRPTVMHLLGIDTKDYIQFGTDLLSSEHSEIVPFRNGNFVTPEVTAVDGKYYDTKTGLLIEANEDIKQSEEVAETKLRLSDKTVYGDLLRFYTPEGFKTVDPTLYDYNKREEK
ncbi:LTA synthase family protein [Metabacillus fastidiosus]|uniref:LTA synthase family protein n=1 Tax=Metabacillus fastidiosus TaxID=1458 RepID=A0ABU6P342_9BACI|nr:LTA synthase family protein [Metabacillus fastidiosus]MED4403782.1 LTA synthase family protein [Metabacillus fastidiosus]MED4452561.1 LTA synthase family protein [Metabacillus fastidiosus]MED4463508.1 LTA synthase family protein [Metabacillus fastidiosus]